MFFKRNELSDLLEAKDLAFLSAKNELVFECKERKTNSRKWPEMQQKYEKISNSRRPQSQRPAPPVVVALAKARVQPGPEQAGFPSAGGNDGRALIFMTTPGSGEAREGEMDIAKWQEQQETEKRYFFDGTNSPI